MWLSKRNVKKFQKLSICIFLLLIIYLMFMYSNQRPNNFNQPSEYQIQYNQDNYNLAYKKKTKKVKSANRSLKHDEIQAFLDFKDDILSEKDPISMNTLLKTILFMIDETPNDDPELVEFVRTLIAPPSNKPLNLINKAKTDWSQYGQSKFIDELLKSKKNGFFIEAGGFDGEEHSNTLFFETQRQWTGVLIEPIPSQYKALLQKNRNIYAINACIAKSPSVAKFIVFSVLSGRGKEMSDLHKNRINIEANFTNNEQQFAYVPCFALDTILLALNVNKVDYFSLDVEGGEWSVIQTLALNKLDISTFTIEWAGNSETKQPILDRLNYYGYKLLKEDGQDLYLIKAPNKFYFF